MKSRLLVSVALMAVVFESGSASWFWGGASKPEETLAEESFVSLPSEASQAVPAPAAEPVAVAAAPEPVAAAEATPVVEEVKAEAAVVPVAVAEPKEKFEYAEGSLSKRKLRKAKKDDGAVVAQPEPTPVAEQPSAEAATKTEEPAAASQSVGLFGWLWGSSAPAPAPQAPTPATEEPKAEPKAEAKEEAKAAEATTPKPLSRKARRAAKQKQREAEKKAEEPAVAAPAPAPSSGGWFSFLWGSSNVATLQEEKPAEPEEESEATAEGETAAVAEAPLSASDDTVECPSQKSQVKRRPGTVKSVELREQTLSAVETVMQALCQDPECSTYKFVKLSTRILKRIDDLAAAYALETVKTGPRFRVYRRTRMAPFDVDFARTAELTAADAAETKKAKSPRARSSKVRVRRFDSSTRTTEAVEKKLPEPTPGSPKDLPHAQKNPHRTQWGYLSKYAPAKRSGKHRDLDADDLDLGDDDASYSRSSYSIQEDDDESSDWWYDSEEDDGYFYEDEEADAEFVESLFRFEEPAKPVRRGPKRPTPYLDAVKRNLPGYGSAKGKEEVSEDDEVYDISGLFAEPKRSKARAASEDEVFDISGLFAEPGPSKNTKRRQKKAAAASRK